jgi:hypothetical protein
MARSRSTLCDARVLTGAAALGIGLAALSCVLAGAEPTWPAPAVVLPFCLAAATGVAKTTTP